MAVIGSWAKLDPTTGKPLSAHPVVGPLGRPLQLDPNTRIRALALLHTAIDCTNSALGDLQRKRPEFAREILIDALINLRDLRDIISPDPAMERPISDELLQEWLR